MITILQTGKCIIARPDPPVNQWTTNYEDPLTTHCISLNLSGFLKPLLNKISLSFKRQLRLCNMA